MQNQGSQFTDSGIQYVLVYRIPVSRSDEEGFQGSARNGGRRVSPQTLQASPDRTDRCARCPWVVRSALTHFFGQNCSFAFAARPSVRAFFYGPKVQYDSGSATGVHVMMQHARRRTSSTGSAKPAVMPSETLTTLYSSTVYST